MTDFNAVEYNRQRDAEDEMHAKIMGVQADAWVRIGKESRRVNRIMFLLWLCGLTSTIGALAWLVA